MDNLVVLLPVGGLANRMRAIVSTYAWAKGLKIPVIAYWFKDNGMEADFSDLFETPVIDGLVIKDGNRLDNMKYGSGGKRALYIPQLYQHIMFDYSFRDDNQNNYINDVHGGYIYIKSCAFIGKHTKQELHSWTNAIFKVKENLKKRIGERTKSFGHYTVGFHIRRTDNARSITESPTEIFLNYARKEMLSHKECTLYLASDSVKEKEIFKREFPKVITDFKATTRRTEKGIEDALIDMYALSRCNVIYGSFYSSFSEFASIIGNNKLVVVKKSL